MKALIVLSSRLKKTEGALDVRFDERPRIRNRIIVMRLGSKVHHRIDTWKKVIEKTGIANVPFYKLHAIIGYAIKIADVAGISQLVQNSHVRIIDIVHNPMDKVRADKTSSPRYKYIIH